jgi:hypothetical protein
MRRACLSACLVLSACWQQPLDVNLNVPEQVTGREQGPPDLAVAITAAPGITVTPTSGLLTSASGATARFTVVLDAQPLGNVTIGLSSSDPTQGTLSPTSLTFTIANWNQTQTVTVTGVDDQVVGGDKAYQIITAKPVSVDPAYAMINPPDVSLINKETDTAGFAVTPTSGLSVTAGASTAGFTVHLKSQPTADVSIDLTSSNTTSGGTVSPTSMTFTKNDWASPQPATVTGVDDQIFNGDHLFSIVTSAATSTDTLYNGINPSDVAVTSVETDVAGIVVTPTSGLTVTENAGGGHTATFNVKLKSKPLAQVSTTLSCTGFSAHLTTSTNPVVLDDTNWSTGVTVTLTGVHDGVAAGNLAFTVVTAAAVSTDPVYSGMNPSDVGVTVIDNDSAGISVVGSGVNMTEGGSFSFTIALNSVPTGSVSFPLSSTNSGAAQILNATPIVISDTTPVTVTVSAPNNTGVDGTRGWTINLGTTTSTDSNYNNKSPGSLSGNTFDNDINVYATNPMMWCLGAGATSCPAVDGSGNSNVSVNINLGGSVNFLQNDAGHSIISGAPGSTGLPTVAQGFPYTVTPSARNTPSGNPFNCGVHGLPMSGTLIVH